MVGACSSMGLVGASILILVICLLLAMTWAVGERLYSEIDIYACVPLIMACSSLVFALLLFVRMTWWCLRVFLRLSPSELLGPWL